MQDEIVSKVVYKDIKDGIGAATCKVTECLCWDPPGEWPVKKIYGSNDDMSDKREQ